MRTFNPPVTLFVLSMTLVTWGMIAIYSASTSPVMLTKQFIFAGLGMVALLACYSVDYHLFHKLSFWMMILALVLCALVLIPGIGITSHHARRWLGVGPIRFQPSEFAKLALIVYMAKMLSDRRQYIKSFLSGVMPALMITMAFAVLIVIEPDFGAAFVLCVVIFGMWLAAEMRWFHLLALGGSLMPAALFAFLLEPYRFRRLFAFLVRDKETIMGAGFQLHQSLIAIGSGGLFGRGLGESHQKFSYLTESHTDFIFAIICEETGFVGATLLVLLYVGLIVTGWRVAIRTTDLFGSLLAAGVTLMIFVSTIIHMGVNLGLLPTKGLVLPFVSAGGTSLIVNMMAIGILMNVARDLYAHQMLGHEATA